MLHFTSLKRGQTNESITWAANGWRCRNHSARRNKTRSDREVRGEKLGTWVLGQRNKCCQWRPRFLWTKPALPIQLGNNFKWSSPLRGQDVGDKWFFTEWSVWNGYWSPENLPLREWLPLKIVWALESPALTTPELGVDSELGMQKPAHLSGTQNEKAWENQAPLPTGRSHWSGFLFVGGWGSVTCVPSRHCNSNVYHVHSDVGPQTQISGVKKLQASHFSNNGPRMAIKINSIRHTGRPGSGGRRGGATTCINRNNAKSDQLHESGCFWRYT